MVLSASSKRENFSRTSLFCTVFYGGSSTRRIVRSGMVKMSFSKRLESTFDVGRQVIMEVDFSKKILSASLSIPI